MSNLGDRKPVTQACGHQSQGECSEHWTFFFFKGCVLCKSSLISVAVICVSCLAIRNILILQLASLFSAVHKHAALEMQPSKHEEGSTRHHF